MGWKLGLGTTALLAGAIATASGVPAAAVDEIQLYNAEIAEVGQFTIQHHFNYTFIGRTTPDFPGGLVPNHALNATPEFAYGVTDWFEAGLYLPWAVDSEGRFLSNNFKLRTLFVTPNADKKDFFYGINFEYDFPNPKFDQNRFAMEIRPIIGWRNPQWEFIVNPIVDAGFGSQGYVDFAPAARLARKLAADTFLAVEYYTDLGQFGGFNAFEHQQHQLFAVVDFKVGVIDVDFGVGYGLTSGSDRLLAKTILTYAFPVPGKSEIERHFDEGAADDAQLAAAGLNSAIFRRPVRGDAVGRPASRGHPTDRIREVFSRDAVLDNCAEKFAAAGRG